MIESIPRSPPPTTLRGSWRSSWTEWPSLRLWTTPKIDNVETINRILNAEARQQYIDSNRDMLKEQARNFYSGVIASIDPTLEVAFEFSG